MRDVLSSFAAGTDGLTAAPGEVDYLATFEQMLHASGAMAHVGLRAGVAMCALSAWAPYHRSFASLDASERTAHLESLLANEAHLVRELSFFVKVQASLAMLGTRSVRARSSYDLQERRGEDHRSGTRRLPVLAADEVEVARAGEVA